LYRTSPTDLFYNGTVWHADNNQAIASTNFYPFKYNSDGTLKQFDCEATVQIPLAANITKSPKAPEQYQPDCRIRNWRNVTVTFDKAQTMDVLEFPVFQRTDNLGPTALAGYKMDGPLDVMLTFENGTTLTSSWAASNVSWTPQKISIDVGNASVSSITMGTNATNGCYGNLVGENQGGVTYCATNLVTKKDEKADKAQLYIYKY